MFNKNKLDETGVEWCYGCKYHHTDCISIRYNLFIEKCDLQKIECDNVYDLLKNCPLN